MAPGKGAAADPVAAGAATAPGTGPALAPASAAALSGLALPVSAVQKSRFPYLQHFAARGKVEGRGKDQKMTGYEVRMGLVLGFKTGRELTLHLVPGMPARALAALLRQAAASMDEWADVCDAEGTDPRDAPQAAPDANPQA